MIAATRLWCYKPISEKQNLRYNFHFVLSCITIFGIQFTAATITTERMRIRSGASSFSKALIYNYAGFYDKWTYEGYGACVINLRVFQLESTTTPCMEMEICI